MFLDVNTGKTLVLSLGHHIPLSSFEEPIMNPTRIVYGVLLFTLCVFGLPEGCLVFASHEVSSPLFSGGTESASRPGEVLTFSARHAE